MKKNRRYMPFPPGSLGVPGSGFILLLLGCGSGALGGTLSGEPCIQTSFCGLTLPWGGIDSWRFELPKLPLLTAASILEASLVLDDPWLLGHGGGEPPSLGMVGGCPDPGVVPENPPDAGC